MLFVCYNKKEIFYVWGKVLKKENIEEYKIFNWTRFFLTLLIFAVLCGIGVWLKNLIDLSTIPWLQYEYNASNMTTAMSAVCQVQAAIVGIVLTVLSVSISINKNEVYGLEIKEIIILKTKGTNYSILEMIIIQVALIAFSIVMLVISCFTLIIVSFLSSCILVVVICIADLPIVLNAEEAAKNIVEKAVGDQQRIDQHEHFIKVALADQLLAKGFSTTKEFFVTEDNRGKLILLMLKTVKEMAQRINGETDEATIKRMLSICFFNIADDELLKTTKDNDDFIDGIVVTINETIKNFKERALYEYYVSAIVWHLMEKIRENDDEYITIYETIMDRLIIGTLGANDLYIIELVREHFYHNIGDLFEQNDRNKYYNKIFFDISLYLYRLSIGEASDEIKKKISDFIHEKIETGKNETWGVLFFYFTSFFNLKLDDIKVDDKQYRANFYAQNCFIHAYNRYDFWLKCWLLKSLKDDDSIENIDLQELHRDLDQWDDSLKQDFANAISPHSNDRENKISYESRKYDTEQSLALIYDVFELKKHSLTSEQSLALEQSIFDLKNELKKKLFITDHDKKQSGYDENKMNEFASIILRKLNEAIPASAFFDESISLDDGVVLKLYLQIDKDMKNGFSEYYKNQIINSISKEIDECVCKELLKNDIDTIENIGDLENLPSKLKKIDVDYYRRSVLDNLKGIAISEVGGNLIDAIEENATRVYDGSIPKYFYMNKDGFSYNCKIESIVPVPFNVDNLPDEIYTIEQIFFNLEEYKEIANKYYYRLLINLKIAIHFDRDKCLMVDEKIFKN